MNPKAPWLRTQLSGLVIRALHLSKGRTQQPRSEASREKPRFREAHCGRAPIQHGPEGRRYLKAVPIPSPQRASRLRVEMVRQASHQGLHELPSAPALLALCLGSRPTRQWLPRDLAPRREADRGGDKSAPVSRKGDGLVSVIIVLGGGSDLE